MRKYCIALITACGWLTCAAQVHIAQITNVPPTRLEAFEAQTDTVIVKGAGQIGSLGAGEVTLTVISKESLDVSSGRKEYGVAIEAVVNNQRMWKKVIDYDEIDPLLDNLVYVAKIDYNVTALPTFVAGFATRSGFRVGAFTSQRRGAIQFFLQDYTSNANSANGVRILVTPTQLSQLQNLLEQDRKNLDALRAAH